MGNDIIVCLVVVCGRRTAFFDELLYLTIGFNHLFDLVDVRLAGSLDRGWNGYGSLDSMGL